MTDAPAPAARTRLPDRRISIRQRLVYKDSRGDENACDVSFGFDKEGIIREVFCLAAKEGTDLQGIVHDACIAASIALQRGERIADLAKSFGELRGEGGKAGAPASVIGALARVGAALEAELGAKQQALPDKKYGVILADPEWEFKAWNPVTGIDRSAAQHYPVSPDAVISARNVQKISDKDCVLFLWCTDPARGVRALEAWGFEYKSYFVWVKDIVPLDGVPGGFETVGPPGTGYWKRDRCELLLVGTRGKPPAPAPGTQPESVFFAARPKIDGTARGKHSAKPEIVHEWIERLFPTLTKIELNARAARIGWDCWGLEAPPPAPEDENQDRCEYEFNQDGGNEIKCPAKADDEATATEPDVPWEGRAEAQADAGSAGRPDAFRSASATSEEMDVTVCGDQSGTAAFDPDRDMPSFLRRAK